MALRLSFHYVWMAVAILTSRMIPTSAEVATYIIHMDLSAMPRAFSGHRSWYTSVVSAAATTPSDSISATSNLIYVYDNAIHGFSARLSPLQLQQLKRSHGYLSCYREMPMTVDTTHTPEFLHLSSGSGLWPASNYGEDVIIGVVDSGIWPERESFSDDSMTDVPARWKGVCEQGTAFSSSACNRKLIGARSFNKGLLAANPNLTIAVNSPRDTDGHGTHTSSTAVGNYVPGASFFGYAPGTAQGMAPRARLAMYKAIWDEGAVTSDIIAAIDQAISDGVDVISLSLGLGFFPLYKDPIAMASFAAMEKGIFVATSAGNYGPGLRVLHNGTPWVTTIGAATVDRDFASIVDLGDGSSINGQSMYPGRPPSTRHHALPLVFMGSCGNRTLLKNARHKMVVCDAKDLEFATSQVESTKVDAALFVSAKVHLYVKFSFPGAIISPQDGKTILEYINKSSDPRAMLRFRETILGTKPAPMAADYTSRGPSVSCPTVLKPDILAPGSFILAAWAQNSSVGFDGSHKLYSPFNIISGTSMACPHAAGIAAMIKGARPDWSPAAIRSALMTTANNLDNTMMPIRDMGYADRPAATPLAIGSGHIEPNRALDPGLVYDASTDDYVRLLCAMKYTSKQIKTITKTYSFDCSHASLDLNYPSFIAFFNPNKTAASDEVVQEFRRTVTNVGDAVVTYNAKVVAMKGFAIRIVPEKLVFYEKYEKKSFALILVGQMGKKDDEVLHGSLSWVDDKGKYVVRSPIVATTINSTRL
ncbi:subtilisin-like protease SBT3 [Phoenix dactylifera]|uniref:Subtilisin-like protease SBT3 n=1 Tax=Phoenix dactylifera TaxID=42345 RepID=A0A8B7BV07_PHODC|nr:subtilisin-like protease SBT3 [Phoenix dactylifera]